MVVKDTRIVKKAAPEWTPLRRACNSPRSENRLSSKAIEVLVEGSKEKKPEATGLSPAPLQVPHYLLPTINSCNQTRVNAKSLASPSVISRVRKSSQSEACKYGSRNVKGNSLLTPDVGKRVKINGLRPSVAVEKTRATNDRLKPSMAVGKAPVKNNQFKASGAVEKSPVENHRVQSSMAVEKFQMKNNRLKPLMAVEKTPGRASCSKIKVARATCSSRCKHVVKDGDSKVSPKPRCRYAYCSLNHLEHEDPPPIKQFLASRRRLLRSQRSFKWVGLTPVPKSVEVSGDGTETESGVDTGQGLGADVLELCVDIYVNDVGGCDTLVGGSDLFGNCVDGMNDLGKLSVNDPRPIAQESMDCDDYDDGHSMVDGSLFASSASHEDDRIENLESQLDLSDLEVKPDISIEKLMETEFVNEENYGLDGLDVDVSSDDVQADYCGDYDRTEVTEDHCFIPSDGMGSQSGFGESDLGVSADDSMKEFAGVEDVEDENHGLDVGAPTHDVEANYCYEYSETDDNEGCSFIPADVLRSQCDVDELDLGVKADDSMKQFAEVEVVKDDNHGLDDDASVHDVKAEETKNVEDHFSTLSNAMGSECQFDELDARVEADDSTEQFAEAGVVKDDSQGLDVHASVHDVEADETEDGEEHCFIPPTAQGLKCQFDELYLSVKADDSIKQFAEAEVVEDDNHGLDVYASILDVEVDETEDAEVHCFIPPNAQGPQCQFDEVDTRVDADDSIKQFAEVEVVKDDNHGLDDDASVHDVKAEETKNVEDHFSTLSNAMGSECQFDELDVRVEADDSTEQFAEAGVVKDDSHGLDVHASVHDVEADETEDGEEHCFIPPTAQGLKCQFDEFYLSVKADDSIKQFAEAEVVEDDNNGLDVYASILDVEADETEDTEVHCFIPPNAQGPQCQFDEVDTRVDADDSIKQFAEAEVVKDDNHGLDVYVSVHDSEADEAEDSEDHCFIRSDAQELQCQFHELDLRVKAHDSVKQYAEVEDVDNVNHVDASAHDVEASDCYEYSETEDSENRCFIPPNALGSNCIGHPESDGLPSGSPLEFDSCHKGEVKEEHSTISGILGNESVSEVTVNDYAQQFDEFEDDKGGNGGTGTQIFAYESVDCGDFDYTPGGDSEPFCFIQVDIVALDNDSKTKLDSTLNGSDIEPNVIPKQGIEMECTNIAGSPLIELDINISDDNIFRQFSEIEDGEGDHKSDIVVSVNEFEKQCTECEDCITQKVTPSSEYDDCHGIDGELCHPVTEKYFTMHSNSHIESDSPVDDRLIQSSSSSNDNANEVCSNITESCLEGLVAGYESVECDLKEYSHIDSPVDGSLVQSISSSNDDANEDCCNIPESSLEGLVAGYESVESDLKEYSHIAQENVNKHHVAESRISWRRRNARSFGDQIAEAEKVDLRHQTIEERRAAHEWMLDYALTQVVKKLSPLHERKVELLVEAFETVAPISKCEANDLQHDAIGFANLRPMQACS